MENCSDPNVYILFDFCNDYRYRPFSSVIYKGNVNMFSVNSQLANCINQLDESSAKDILKNLVDIYNKGSAKARLDLKERIAKL